MTDAPRILFVDHAGVLGGAELTLLDIAAASRARCAVALFEDGPFASALAERNVPVLRIGGGVGLKAVKKGSRVPGPGALVSVLRAAMQLARAARSFDVLYANTAKSFLVSCIAGGLSRRPVVWHLHDILSREHFSATNIRLMIGTTNRCAARVVTNSRATAEAFVAAGGRRDIVQVVHNGIDPLPFDSVLPQSRERVRRELGIADGAFVVGSFSRLHPWKGQRVLLEALESLPGVHAVVVGGALFSGEDTYEAELRERSSSAGLAGRVQLLGVRCDVAALMHACDVIVHTSILPEPFGRVLVEALLSRRPLVATRGGGVTEIVQDGVTAVVVTPGDVPGLVAAIAAVRDDGVRAAIMASAGSADVRARFGREAMVDGVHRAIDDVLLERGAKSGVR